MSVKHVTSITREGSGADDKIAPEKLLSGNPETKVWNAFSDNTGQFHVGHWASGPCKIRVSYSENEYCVLTQGSAILTDEDGNGTIFGVGEPFVIQSGFEGTWESVGDVVKTYAIFEASS